jgi:hypothetical protein
VCTAVYAQTDGAPWQQNDTCPESLYLRVGRKREDEKEDIG